MNTSASDLPPSIPSLRHTLTLGYRAAPGLLSGSFLMVLFSALPDALIALWLKLLANGITGHHRGTIIWASIGLAVSSAATWYLRVVFNRVQRRFRDRVSVALESHVAQLQASIVSIEHQERPEYLDRLAVLREQVFTLDHLFMSIFGTLGWILRLAITLVLLASVHPALVLLTVFVIPTVLTATWRPGVERVIEERAAQRNRLARHLFVVGTTAPAGKEVRQAGIGEWLETNRRNAWAQWYEPVASTRVSSAVWHSIAWAIFGAAYVGAIVFVSSGLHRSAGAVLLVLAAGSRLSQYVGAAVGELGFLRGIWLDASRRLLWLENYAKASDETGTRPAPALLTDGIHLEHVSFRYPGTDRLVLDDVTLDLPAGGVVAVVGENGAGKTTLVKLLTRMYEPESGHIDVDGVDLATIRAADWRNHVAGAFQDFFRFEFQAQQAVGLGDVERLDSRPAVQTAVGRAGADDVIERLTSGLDTQLGPSWESGVDVSFGQWQKLALARGFMRDAPLLLVLDEPTAALDAETEHALFERYAQASRGTVPNGRITILVSHRFSTVRMADLIVVLDGSHVVEVGSHEELMAREGVYRDLYTIQAAAFR